MSSSFSEISFWEQAHLFHSRDIIIIGAGLVGMHTAIAIKKNYPSAKITLLERSIYSQGASTRNAGFACFGNIGEWADDIRNMPEHQSFEMMAKRFKGLKMMRDLLGDTTIDYQPTGSYEMLPNDNRAYALLEHIPFVNQKLEELTGLKNVFREATNSFGFSGSKISIHNSYEGELNTGKLFQALRSLLRQYDVEVLSGMEVERYECDPQGAKVFANGWILPCRKLILTTNAFTGSLLPNLDIQPARGQIILTEKLSDFHLNGIFFFDAGYYYWRMLDGGILLGGGRNLDPEGETTFAYGRHPEIVNQLENFLYTNILGNQSKPAIRMRWSGIMAMGTSKFPIIQEVDQHVFAAVRMGGMGVALSALAAQEVLEWYRTQD